MHWHGLQAGDMIFVSNETGGATMAFYDGSTGEEHKIEQLS